MDELLSRLVAIKETAKDIHYKANGESFYGIHLLMDRVADGIEDQIDSIKEVCFLGANMLPPKTADIFKKALELIPSSDNWRANIAVLQTLLLDTLLYIEGVEVDAADANLVGTIAESLQLKLGLISRTVAK